MFKTKKIYRKTLLALTVSALLPINSFAATDLEVLRQEVDQLKKRIAGADEWKVPNTLVHMAGYADVGYSNSGAANDDGSFNAGRLAPIFHYQYRDIVMLESELEFKTMADGSTETALEYLTLDVFLNDYVTLVAGKFLSPIGTFRQNIHPSWINKMASAAPGFGHDGAAPVSDTGFQLRGGFHIGDMKANYAVYTGNGPEIKAELTPNTVNNALVDDIEYDGIDAEGFGVDADGNKVFGGRFGILPMPSLEIGVSLLTGKADVTSFENVGAYTGNTATLLSSVTSTNYDVAGVDVSWRNKTTDVRFEYVQSKLGAATMGANTLASAKWTTWYGQAAYKIPATKYEVVARYADFNSPVDSNDRQQVAVGVNYLFTSNFIAKVNYESNKNPNAAFNTDNRVLVQMAYGF